MTNVKDIQCNYCGLITKSQEDLTKHEKYVHVKVKCQLCNYVAFGDRDMKSHTARKHVP